MINAPRSRILKTAMIAMVVAHSALLACYTFPEVLVPEKLRILGQWYARPLFHQQWKLFAPDPPICACMLEWHNGDNDWRPVAIEGMHYLEQRMIQNHCHYLAEGWFGAERDALPALLRFTESETSSLVRFRVVEACITDPALPAQRRMHIIPLYGP